MSDNEAFQRIFPSMVKYGEFIYKTKQIRKANFKIWV